MAIEVSDLERMAEKLYVYDVVQDGWEHDPEGSHPKSVEHNLKHVGEHLAGVLALKDFFDAGVVQRELVPDFMQYGLRIARWGDINPRDLIGGGNPYIPEARQINKRLSVRNDDRTLPVVSLIYANGILLGRQMHDEDHDDIRTNAMLLRNERLTDVSSILVRTALFGDAWHGDKFDVEQVFDARLAALRDRFDIPQPEEA